MKKFLIYFLFLTTMTLHSRVSDFMLQPVPKKLDTKEDLIRIDSATLDQNEKQASLARNIYFLELAIVMPFANPIKALIRITNEKLYQKYQYAIYAYLYQRLAEEYIQYGRLFYKENIYFYNDDFHQDYLDGYDIAEFYFKSSLYYRRKAAEEAGKARAISGELNPNMDQSFIDFDQKIYILTDNPYDFEFIYQRIFNELETNREKIIRWQETGDF